MDQDNAVKSRDQIFNAINIYAKTNQLYKALLDSLVRVEKSHRLEFIDEHDIDSGDDDDSRIRGFFSSHYNRIFIVMYDDYFKSKMLFFNDYDNIDRKQVKMLVDTLLHEMIHYVAFNNTTAYLQLWNTKQITLLKYTFVRLALICGDMVLPKELQDLNFKTPNDILNNPKFTKAFDTYYKSIRQSDMMVMSNFNAIYNNALKPMYSTCNWAWVRFFDNILYNCILVADGDREMSIELYSYMYRAIREAYIMLFPNIEKSEQFKSMFYQELLVPSEIACIEVSCSDTVSNLQPLAIKTLQLV